MTGTLTHTHFYQKEFLMKSLLSALVAFSLLGCTTGSHEHGDHPHGDAHPEASPAPDNERGDAALSGDAKTVEVACASCIYEMPGVSGCKLAAKIDGKPVLVTGTAFDAHKSGLCSGAKQAIVKGELRGGEFVATEVKLK